MAIGFAIGPSRADADFFRSDEEVRQDRHRQGGKCSGDRSGPDLLIRKRQTLWHGPEIASLAGEIKFLKRRSDRDNFQCNYNVLDPFLRTARSLTPGAA